MIIGLRGLWIPSQSFSQSIILIWCQRDIFVVIRPDVSMFDKMPAPDRFIPQGFLQKSSKQDILISPRTKRLKNGKQRGNRAVQKLGQPPKLCILSKPESSVINGKTRCRFPDPTQDKCVLLGLFDKEQTLIKLHYIDNEGISIDETLEKEIMKNPHGEHYFLKFEQVQIDHASGGTEIQNKLHNNRIICAKLNDHTVSDTSVPEEVAGFWVRVFGPESTFTLNFTLWSAEARKSSYSHFPCKGNGGKEDFYNLVKLDEIHVQFGNEPRHTKKRKNGKTKMSEAIKQNLFECKELMDTIKSVRYIRDNGKVEEFDAKCYGLLKNAKRKGNLDEELALILEQSTCLCYQGNASEGKKLLQRAVQRSSKSKNSTAIKNRAYLFLAFIHINDGSYGTAQECLGMVDKEVNSSLSAEDMALRSLLHGIIMMNFGQRLNGMSQTLWHEAGENFENALDYCQGSQSAMVTDDSICMIHLWMARLFIGMLKAACSPGCKMPELENKVLEHLNYFDDIEPVKLSRRTTITGLLLQGEYQLFLHHNEDGHAIFDNILELIAIDSRFYYYETKYLGKVREQEDEIGNTDHGIELAMLAKMRDLLAKSDSDTGYSADESSSDEKIDLEDVRYNQTTYV